MIIWIIQRQLCCVLLSLDNLDSVGILGGKNDGVRFVSSAGLAKEIMSALSAVAKSGQLPCIEVCSGSGSSNSDRCCQLWPLPPTKGCSSRQARLVPIWKICCMDSMDVTQAQFVI